jgi:hypothetical protein
MMKYCEKKKKGKKKVKKPAGHVGSQSQTNSSPQS